MILPIVSGIVLKILTRPASEGISITGAQIYFTIRMPVQDLPITESQINSWLVMISIFGLCLFLTRNLKTRNIGVRQHLAEWLVEKADGLVGSSMGEYFMGFSPFIGTIIALSAFSSLITLFGLFPPTSDLNVVAGWAVLVFVLITYYKSKCGPLSYLKSFANPVLMAPLNVISEVATPISMAFRHYGNVLSGSVISVLIAAGLQGLSAMVLGWLPGFLGEIPFLQIGLPAILSIYFDVFSGCLQAYIFAMLTMMYVAGGFPMEEYFAKKEKKKLNKANI
ncbi:MAG: F0F1 ATP synthase subunit A [Clostridia bacterium]|nr:F0F1 ATP synthase subunit A [Clostridia bacterium]